MIGRRRTFFNGKKCFIIHWKNQQIVLCQILEIWLLPPPKKTVLYRQRLSTASPVPVWESEAERVLHSSAHFQSVNEISEYYPTAHISPTWPEVSSWIQFPGRTSFQKAWRAVVATVVVLVKRQNVLFSANNWTITSRWIFFVPFFIFYLCSFSFVSHFFLIHLFHWCISAHKILQCDFSFLILQSVSITARPCAADTSNNHRWKPDPPCLYLAQ